MISFLGKRILVTGASSGIGKEICIHLSELGASVVLVARNEKELKKTISLMKGDNHNYFIFDLKEIDKINNLICNIFEQDNIKFDGFIHSAGVPSIYPLKILNYKKIEDTFKINTFSYLEIIRHLSKKQFSNNGMSVIYLSSILTKKVRFTSQISYIMSKSSGENISKALSLELKKRNIRVNSVIIDDVETNMHKKSQDFQSLEFKNLNNKTKIFKFLSTREVSNVIMFLMSNSAKYIIGESYYINGKNI